MCSNIEKEAREGVQAFCDEAERLAPQQATTDSLANLAALQLLSLALIGYGKDHCVLKFRNQAVQMATRMQLLNVDRIHTSTVYKDTSDDMKSALSYATWGTFNWTVLTSLFYQQPGFEYPEKHPVMPIPRVATSTSADSVQPLPFIVYMGETMRALCKFWLIMHGVSQAYYKRSPDNPESICERVSLDYAELKLREILAWSESLPRSLTLQEESPHHVVVFHIWLHCAILDLFRPFLSEKTSTPRRLKTFYSEDSSPDVVFNASVKRLKHLIILYRSQYAPSTYSSLWHTALIYVANAILQDTDDDPEWRFYLLLCVYGYVHLRQSFRLAEAAGLALLSMTLLHSSVPTADARSIAEDLRAKGLPNSANEDNIRATFMADLSLAVSDPSEASVEKLARRFDDIALFQEYTNMEDVE
jgi:hypothetical protein